MQGSFYAGTGCFQRRKVIYGVPPNGSRLKKKGDRYISRLQLLECSLKNNSTEMLSHEALRLFYGNSMEFMQSAVQITAGISSPGLPADLSSRVAEAKMVASCSYEFNTAWGDEVCITPTNSNFFFGKFRYNFEANLISFTDWLGLRFDDGGHPHRPEVPLHGMENGASDAGPACVPRLCPHRRSGELDAVQEVGNRPSRDPG